MSEAMEKVVIKRTLFEKIFDVLALAALLVTIIYLMSVWSDLPARIPSHYNGAGEVDGWGGKGALLVFIVIGTAVWIGSTVLERFPQIHNHPVQVTEENKGRLMHNTVMMLGVMKNIILLYFCYSTWRMVQDAYGPISEYASLDLPIFLVVLFGSMAYFIWRGFKLR